MNNGYKHPYALSSENNFIKYHSLSRKFLLLPKDPYSGKLNNVITIIGGGETGNCEGRPFVPPAMQGPTDPDYDLQWIVSTDDKNWSEIPGATDIEYEPREEITQTTIFRVIAKPRPGLAGKPDTSEYAIFRILKSSDPVTNNTISFPGGFKELELEGSEDPPEIIEGSLPEGQDNILFRYTWEYSYDNITWNISSGNIMQDYYDINKPETNPVVDAKVYFRRIVSSDLQCAKSNISNIISLSRVKDKETDSDSDKKEKIIKVGKNVLCPAEPPVLKIEGSPLHGVLFQWLKSYDNNAYEPIPGANSVDYDTDPVTRTTFFKRISKNGSNVDTSNEVKVYPAFGENKISSDQVINKDETPEELIGNIGSEEEDKSKLNYTWEQSADKNLWTQASGINDKVNYRPEKLSKTTYFRRILKHTDCSDVSYGNTVEIRINDYVVNNKINPPDITAPCGIDSFKFGEIIGSDPAQEGSYTIAWEYSIDGGNTWKILDGITSLSYDPPVISQSTSYRRSVTLKNNNEIYVSNTVDLKLYPHPIENNTISEDQSIKEGDIPNDIKGMIPSGGGGEFTYLWQRSDKNTIDAIWHDAGGINNQSFYNFTEETKPNATMYLRRTAASLGGCVSHSNIVEIKVISQADLSIGLKAEINDAYDGSLLYIATVKNNGPNTAYKVDVNDLLPKEVECLHVENPKFTGSVDLDKTTGHVKWSIPEMKSGQILDLYIYVKPLVKDNIQNTVTVTGETFDPDMSNNTSKIITGNIRFDVEVMPNILTPNGDGINDYLKFSEITSFSSNRLSIYDRWGTAVYDKQNYENNWDGQALAAGTYYYILSIKIGNKEKIYKGYLTLVR